MNRPLVSSGRRTSAIAMLVAFAVWGLAACGDDAGASTSEASDECPTVTIDSSGRGNTRTPPEPADLATAVAEGFCATFVFTGPASGLNGQPSVNAADARCIADQLIAELGEQRVREAGFTNPWSLLFFALSNRSIEREESEQIVEVFAGCADGWELLLVRSVTAGASEISDESARCVADRLDDEKAREILAGEIDRAYDDPGQADATPFPELVQPLVEAMDACLSPEELDRMDWN